VRYQQEVLMIRLTRQFWGAICSLVLVSLLTFGLATTAAAPALAGSGGFNTTGSMNFARDGHTATLLSNGEVLVTGGFNYTNGFLASAELYNPANGKWTLTGSMSFPRTGNGVVLLQNGEVLVAGGSNPTICCGGAPPLASAELYDPATGTWTATSSMTTARNGLALVLLQNGEVLAVGGDQAPGSATPSTAELYNPATGTWTATGSMTTAAGSGGAILLPNGDVFVADVDIYHPSTGTFTALSSPAPSGVGGPIGLVLNGNVLTYGAFGGGIYNPSTNQWTTYPRPPCDTFSQNCGAGAALLNTGILLVAGGITKVNAQPYPIEETNGLAELFDPSTLTWASTGKMNKDRIGQSMTLLPNGQVLAAGGESFDKGVGALRPIATCELYTP
jgi:N-acetylneuraminic acid mutarotase